MRYSIFWIYPKIRLRLFVYIICIYYNSIFLSFQPFLFKKCRVAVPKKTNCCKGAS